MKRFLPILIFLLLTLSVSAQSVMILHSLDMVDNATALTHYYNLFGSFNMPERDDPFPYSVIRIDLEGDANAVRQAKLQLGLNLGRLQKVQSMDKGTPNQILFLVESSVKNIYLTCGDGCEEQLLYTGSLQSNRIYACKVQYEPVAANTTSNGVSSEQMEQMMAMMQQMQEQMQQMQNQGQSQQDQGGNSSSNNLQDAGDVTYNSALHISNVSVNGTSKNNITLKLDDISYTMIFVEGGTFIMGEDKKKLAHQVTLSDYYIGQTEVTQGLWNIVMGENPSSDMYNGNLYPVNHVSWEDCQIFIKKLNSLLSSKLGDKRFALPTEAQWEYAARGGNKSQGYKYSGSNNLREVVGTTYDGLIQPVGLKQANELGLFDMSGNVREWCQDWYADYSSSSQTNPAGPASGEQRVCRGTSVPLALTSNDFKVSYRRKSKPDSRALDLGLRLVLYP